MYPQLTKIILSIIIIILSNNVLPLPWWAFSIITLVIGFISNTERESIINGFIIGFLSWFICLIYSYYNGGFILFQKMSILLNINNSILLIGLSSVLSGLLGAISSFLGWQYNKR